MCDNVYRIDLVAGNTMMSASSFIGDLVDAAAPCPRRLTPACRSS